MSDNTLIVTCVECGARYELKPAREDPAGGGWYSSDKDFCRKCGGDTRLRFKDGREACHGWERP